MAVNYTVTHPVGGFSGTIQIKGFALQFASGSYTGPIPDAVRTELARLGYTVGSGVAKDFSDAFDAQVASLFSESAPVTGAAVATFTGGVATVGDANATLTARSSAPTQVWKTPLTANRTVTLSTTGAVNGDAFRVTRTAASTGAFTLTVAGKALSAGQWADVVFDGTAWLESASGSL